jgi:flagellar biosynthesis protein FliQ
VSHKRNLLLISSVMSFWLIIVFHNHFNFATLLKGMLCEYIRNYVCIQEQTLLYLSRSVYTAIDESRTVTETSHASEKFIHLG